MHKTSARTETDAYVIRGDEVTWQPAVDVNRIVTGAFTVAELALFVALRISRWAGTSEPRRRPTGGYEGRQREVVLPHAGRRGLNTLRLGPPADFHSPANLCPTDDKHGSRPPPPSVPRQGAASTRSRPCRWSAACSKLPVRRLLGAHGTDDFATSIWPVSVPATDSILVRRPLSPEHLERADTRVRGRGVMESELWHLHLIVVLEDDAHVIPGRPSSPA